MNRMRMRHSEWRKASFATCWAPHCAPYRESFVIIVSHGIVIAFLSQCFLTIDYAEHAACEKEP